MENTSNILSIIEKTGSTPDKLIEILIAVQAQSKEHCITEEDLKLISEELHIPVSKAYGVASFYSMLSTVKKGKYIIQVCKSGPCYVKKYYDIVSVIEGFLGIKAGEKTPDGLFSLEYTSCFGACDIGPAVKINDEIYGNLTCEKIVKILEDLKQEVV
jgi:NADH-quinone oxidoreductase subunit E